MTPIRYAAAACQTDFPNPLDRRQMSGNTDRMLSERTRHLSHFAAIESDHLARVL